MTPAALLFFGSAAYIGLAHGSGLLLHLAACAGLRKAEESGMLAELPQLHSDLEPPITLVLHVHDNAARAAACTRALLALHYPALEVIVVNDGSQDRTMEALRDAFELLPFPEAYRIQLPTQPVTQIYRSTRHANLRVLDKQAGGCADAWNAGINAARTPLVCCIDCDISLQPDSLHSLALPFLADADTSASTGALSKLSHDDRMSSRLAFVSALRSQLFAPLGWSALNALLVAPSGVQLLRKEAVIEAGGYQVSRAAPEAGLLMRLHALANAKQRPYRIVFVGEALGSRQPLQQQTESERCRAWQRILLGSACSQRALLWRHQVRWQLRLAFVYLLLFECLGPLLEVASYAWIAVAAATGLISSQACMIFLLFAVSTGTLLSLSALLLDALSFRQARKLSEPRKLVASAVMENLGYRQMRAWWRTVELTSSLRRARAAGMTRA
ncbi:MAG TPA: glycosyltransferase family 2 protein [Oxalicibacterium sp.]|nr:glycosyltransferase family 2 protein [Oxalicibacterium sp.]